MSSAREISAGRQCARDDQRGVIERVLQGVDALHALVAEWPGNEVTSAHIIGVERSTVALQGLLVRLKALVSP